MSRFKKDPLEEHNSEAIKSFIAGAELKTKPVINELPWSNLDDIEKVKGQNLRMTKADLAKVQYIAQNTPYSAQRFIYEAFRNALDKKIEELI